MDVVIIIADLCNEPTQKLAFHWLTTEAHFKRHLSMLVEAEDYAKDIYYKFLRSNGLMDGIEGIVTPQENVDAIRLDRELNFPNTILTDLIYSGNIQRLFKSICGLADFDFRIQEREAQKLLYKPEN